MSIHEVPTAPDSNRALRAAEERKAEAEEGEEQSAESAEECGGLDEKGDCKDRWAEVVSILDSHRRKLERLEVVSAKLNTLDQIAANMELVRQHVLDQGSHLQYLQQQIHARPCIMRPICPSDVRLTGDDVEAARAEAPAEVPDERAPEGDTGT